MNNNAMNILEHVFWWVYIHISTRYVPYSETPGSQGIHMLGIIQQYKIIFLSESSLSNVGEFWLHHFLFSTDLFPLYSF